MIHSPLESSTATFVKDNPFYFILFSFLHSWAGSLWLPCPPSTPPATSLSRSSPLVPVVLFLFYFFTFVSPTLFCLRLHIILLPHSHSLCSLHFPFIPPLHSHLQATHTSLIILPFPSLPLSSPSPRIPFLPHLACLPA